MSSKWLLLLPVSGFESFRCSKDFGISFHDFWLVMIVVDEQRRKARVICDDEHHSFSMALQYHKFRKATNRNDKRNGSRQPMPVFESF
jgi:hypothetical protein